jgi:DNA-binding MarR family transcriptional regulator
MVESGYIVQKASQTDQRVQYVSLTEKGLTLYDTLERTFQSYLKAHEQKDIHNLQQSLKNIETNLKLSCAAPLNFVP